MANQLLHVMQLISSLEVGGAEKLLIDFVASCRDDDQVALTVVVMNQGVNPDMRERLERQGINVYFLDRPESHKHPKYLRTLLDIIHRHQIQMIHAHNMGSKLWALLCKLVMPQLKLVVTIHDTPVVSRLSKAQLWIHQHWIDTHIAISKSVAQTCDARGLANYHQIFNGINFTPFSNPHKPTLEARIRKESFDACPLKIIHVGRMDYPKKGQDLLIEAVGLCRQQGLNVACVLMGGVYDYNRKSYETLQAMVQERGLEGTVEFRINQTNVPESMAEADLFVLSSRFEGFGLVILEAMAANLPVLVSNIEGPRELVEDGVNGFTFESGNAQALAAKIREIYENPARVDQAREVAARSVQQYDIHRMKRQYCWLYKAMVNGNSQGLSVEADRSLVHDASL